MRAPLRLAVFTVLLFTAFVAAAQQNPNWSNLMLGNDAYARNLLSAGLVQRPPVADGQRPPVSVLSCADSRVAPEVIFNQSIGQVFLVRTAGNLAARTDAKLADQFPLASLEYAVLNKWTQLIVVLGHEDCGAVKSALNPAGDGALTEPLKALVAEIRMSFGGIPRDQWDPNNPAIVRRATDANALRVADKLPKTSTLIRDSGVKIVAAYYELSTGRVVLLPVP